MKRLIFAGILVFLVVMIVTLPARLVYRFLAPPDLSLTGISGSIWNGAAAEGLAAGAYFRNLSWKTDPLSLLGGKLALSAAAEPAGGTLKADVSVGLSGALTLTEVTGRLPLNLIHDTFQQAGMQGDVTLDFVSLVIQNGLPEHIDGNIVVANLYNPALSAARLGDYRAEFQTRDGNVTASVDDLSGVLDVAGVLTLMPDRSYSLQGGVAARPDAPPSITQQLQFLGSPDERGLRSFRFEGTL